MKDNQWTVGYRSGDWLRRLRCHFTGHDWSLNKPRTQKVCYRCWTIEELR